MDKCPFCGAERALVSVNLGAVIAWKCETNYAIRTHYSNHAKVSGQCCALFRSEICYDRQITALQELLELHRAFLRDLRYVDRHTYENISPHARALKEKGEWPE
jgi:hypothetical protein